MSSETQEVKKVLDAKKTCAACSAGSRHTFKIHDKNLQNDLQDPGQPKAGNAKSGRLQIWMNARNLKFHLSHKRSDAVITQ